MVWYSLHKMELFSVLEVRIDDEGNGANGENDSALKKSPFDNYTDF